MIISEENGVHIVYIVTDALYDDAKVNDVQRRIEHLLDDQPIRHLVLDFKRVTSAGSAGLSMLVRLKTRCDESGCGFGISGLNPTILEVMQITKLDELITIRPTAAQFVPST